MFNKALLSTATAIVLLSSNVLANGGGSGSWPAGHFGYEGSSAAHFWDEVEPEKNSLCAMGKKQSPINLLDSEVKTVVKEKGRTDVVTTWSETATDIGFKNLGHTVQVGPFPPGFDTEYKGLKLSVLQFHFHAPSEHHIGNDFAPMEVHFVHKSAEGALGVIGIMINIDDDNTESEFLAPLVAALPSIGTLNQEAVIPLLNFTTLFEENRDMADGFYTYTGSLTTPPCTEGVNWMVAKNGIKISGAQWNTFRSVMKFSARQTQRRVFPHSEHDMGHSAADKPAVSALPLAVAALLTQFLF